MNSKTQEPLVCICIPTYNAQSTIKETLASIVSQTYKNIIIKIVDNCSTDETLDIARTFNDPRIELYENEVNIGGEGNFNRCIQLACGDYTAIYHADDVYDPEIIQRQVEFFKINPNVGAVLTEAQLIDEHSKKIKYSKLPESFKTKNNIYNFSQLFKGILKYSNFLFCPSAMVKTDVYKNDIKTFRGELFKTSADLDVWLRIAQDYTIGIIPLPLINYRISSNQWSSKLRRSTSKADFFLVMDFYLQQDCVKKILTRQDMDNYKSLDRRDKAMRAVNLFLQNKGRDAQALCKDIFSWKSLHEAFKNKRGKLTLILGSMVTFFLLINREKLGQKVIERLISRLGK
ncbi:MAG: glycosyltransferase [Legionella sp.]|nr:MAG: glycosyltransferase [Legionella sp.]